MPGASRPDHTSQRKADPLRPKLTVAEQPSKPERCAAENLTPGQFLASGALTTGGPTEVLFVDTYPSANVGRETLIVHRPLGANWSIASTVSGNHWYDLAAEEQLAAFRAGAERAKKIEEIRALAEWLEDNPDVPMPYMTHASEHWSDGVGDPETSAAMATIRNLAQMFDVKLDEHLADRTRFVVPFGKASYELVVWHKGGRPADPEPEASCTCPLGPEDAHFADCPWYVGPICTPERRLDHGHTIACGPMADPTGLAYSRADDGADDPTPVSGARVAPHTGGVTDEGLVDETPGTIEDHLAAGGAIENIDGRLVFSGGLVDEQRDNAYAAYDGDEADGWRDDATGLTSGGLVPNCPTCGGDHHTVEPCR